MFSCSLVWDCRGEKFEMKRINFFTSHRSIGQCILKSLCFVTICVTFFTTCNLGVGETVDVLPPELAIVYPSPIDNIIIRDEFIVQGTVKDDVAVSSVTISLVGTNGVAVSLKNNLATVSGNSWSIILNTPENNLYPIKDGEYVLSVTATDTSGRASYVSGNYEIDNTAPVIYMEQPGSSDVAETYGTLLKIKGQAYDPNIEEITFVVYNVDTLEHIAETSVPLESGAVDTLLGTFTEGGDALDNFYNKIYGSTLDDIKKFRYFVVARDKARTYTAAGTGDTGNENTHYYLHSQVNAIASASSVYAYMSRETEDLYNIKTEVFDYAIFTPSIENSEGDTTESEQTIASSVDGAVTDTPIEEPRVPTVTDKPLGLFSLFPSTAPTYFAVDEAMPLTKVPFENLVLETAPIDVTLNTNNDGDKIDYDTVTIRALQLKDGNNHLQVDEGDGLELKKTLLPGKDDTEFKYSDYYSAAYTLIPRVAEDEDGIEDTVDPKNGTYTLLQKGKKTTDIQFIDPNKPVTPQEAPFEELEYGLYIIEVIGTDVKGSPFYNGGGVYYGFQRISSSLPPIITVDTSMPGLIGHTLDITHEDAKPPTNATIDGNLNQDALIAPFTGSLRSESNEIKEIEYVLSSGEIDLIKKEISPSKNPDQLWPDPDGSKNANDYRWSIPLYHKDFGSPTDAQQYTLSITAIDTTLVKDTEVYTIDYDLQRPTISALTHSVVKTSTDKTISVNIRAQDNSNAFIAGSKDGSTGSYMLLERLDSSGEVKKSIKMPITTPRQETIDFSLNDITDQTDGSMPEDMSVKVTVVVVDSVGLETKTSFIFDSFNPSLSEAKIESPDTASWIDETDIDNPKNWYNTGTLTLSVRAEDTAPTGATASGVQLVEWTIDDPSLDSAQWQTLTKTDETLGIWTGNTNFIESKPYTIHFRATDASLNVSELSELTVYIDINAPVNLTLDKIQETSIGEGSSPIIYSNATQNLTILFKDILDDGTADDGTLSDGTSDAKSVRLVKIGNANFEKYDYPEDYDGYEVSNKSATLTITKEEIEYAQKNGAPSGGTATFRLTDNAGNTADFLLFTLSIDTVKPSANILSPSNNAIINGMGTVSGTANDNSSEIASVRLEYLNKNNGWDVIGEVKAENEGDNLFNWSFDFDTTDEKFDFAENSANDTLTMLLTVTDAGGNTYEEELNVRIRQDEDRPIITITNLILDGMTKDDRVWLKGSGGATAELSGIVTDDDGAITQDNFKIIVNGEEKSPTTYTSGSWSIDLGASGTRDIVFEITDSVGATFTSANLGSTSVDLQNTPKITDGTNKFGYTDTDTDTYDKGSTIRLTVDTVSPTIGDIYIDKTPSEEAFPWFDDTDKELFEDSDLIGGNSKKFALKFEAIDDNTIAKVEWHTDKLSTKETISEHPTEENTYVVLVDSSDLLYFPQEDYATITITVEDAAGEVSVREMPIRIDNTAPTLSVIDPLPNTQVTGVVAVTGSASYNFEYASLPQENAVRYIFPKKNDTETGWIQPLATDEGWTAISAASTSWQVIFGDEASPGGTLKEFTAEHALETETGSGLWRLPIVFRVQDILGNEYITNVEDYILVVDPNGDKPKVSIISPIPEEDETEVVLGGIIRIFGSAEDNVEVNAVYMQIDTDYDGNFDYDLDNPDSDSTDAGFLAKNGYDVKVINPKPDYDPSAPDGSDPEPWWGIKVTGTNSWNTTINENGEFNPETGKRKPIRYRVRSVDNNGVVSAWSKPIIIQVDNTAPRIGSSETIKVVQYKSGNSGTIIAEKNYEPDMWLSGDWYLTGSIEDESGIASYTVTDINSGSIITNNGWFTAKDFDGNPGYRMNIPLYKESGNFDFTIEAKDVADSQSTRREFSFNLNNTEPTISALQNSAGAFIGNGANDATVQQSNGSFTFGSTVNEDGGSGLSHVAFWFERPAYGSEGKRIYNVMEETNNVTTLDNPKDEVPVSIIKRLPRLPLTGVTRNSEDTLQHSKIEGNKNVRVGSVVHIGGIDRLITAVDYNSGIVTFSPGVSTTYTEADIAYVMLVNNRKIESPGTPPINDDGDGMVESVEGSNKNYTWSASIDSKNIPDGPITIYAVAYDNSGLASETYSVDTKIENHRPAIASITLQSDLNGSGTITDTDQKKVYSIFDSTDPDAEKVYDATVNASDFTAKGLTYLIPEIVGGNGNLYYSLQTTDYELDVDTSKPIRDVDVDNDGVIDAEPQEYPIILGLIGNKLLGLDDTNGRVFNFSIWDSTPETTVGNSSQRATLELTMNVDAVDGEAPSTSISAFAQTNKNNANASSLYENSLENGHIELEADLPDNFNAETGIYDRDPKVSGKVTFRGTATDTTALKEIWAKIDYFGFTDITTPDQDFVRLAVFNTVTEDWDITSSDFATNGWNLVVENVDHTDKITPKDFPVVDQDGHTVRWALHWDSQKINKTAQADVKVQIKAVDARGKETTDSYRIDVVPYITSVTTNLTNFDSGGTTASRTALGNYPMYVGETVTIHGYNLEGASLQIENTNVSVTSSESSVVFTVPSGNTLTSGKAELTVNDITNLNNKNSDTAEYNSTPSLNNENLMDDVSFDIWNTNDSLSIFGTASGFGPFYSPELRINPNTGNMGFAYTRDDYFYMPGLDRVNPDENNPSTGTDALRQIERGWAPYYESALAFDNDGNSYGLSTNTDTIRNGAFGNPGYSAYTTFFFDRIGETGGASAAVNQSSSHRGGTYRRRIMSTSTDNADTTSETRVMSPSMATISGDRTNTTPTEVYLAYYDVLSKHIRYQWGTVGATLEMDATINGGTISTTDPHGFIKGDEVTLQYETSPAVYEKLDNDTYLINQRFYVVAVDGNTFKVSTTKDGTASENPGGLNGKKARISAVGGQFKDITGGYMATDYPSDRVVTDMYENKYSIIANGGVSEHVSLDARSLTTGKLVAITYAKDDKLQLAYSTNPQNDTGLVTNTDSYWKIKGIDEKTAVSMFSDVKIDEHGGIHIAYASESLALKYAYLSSAGADPVIVEVDSFDSVGNYLRLSLKEDGTNIVPYISYYSTSLSIAKLAYNVASTVEGLKVVGIENGVKNGMFTGKWEVTHIPSVNAPREDTINVAINNKNDGKITGEGANGTTNPVIAYSLTNKDGIEIVQKR